MSDYWQTPAGRRHLRKVWFWFTVIAICSLFEP